MKITVTDIPGMEDVIIEDAEQLVLFHGITEEISMIMRSNKLFTVGCIRQLSIALGESMGIVAAEQVQRINKEG